MDELQIRRETEAGINAAHHVSARTFAEVEYSANPEPHIVGDVATPPVKISDGTGDWFSIGPLTVDPDPQKVDVGTPGGVYDGLSGARIPGSTTHRTDAA